MNSKDMLLNMATKAMKDNFNALSDKEKHNEFCKLLDEKIELSKMCELYSKSLYNSELNQLKQEKENLIKYLKNELGDRNNPNKDKWLMGVHDAYKEILDRVKENKYE